MAREPRLEEVVLRRIVFILLIPLMLVGCGKPASVTGTGKQPPDNVTWISPGKVQIGNFYPGARAEWPVTIHNGNDAGTETEVKLVTSDIDETEFYVPIKRPLLANSVSNVTTIVSNQQETLTATRYDQNTKSVYIAGFLPNVTREMTVTYSSASEFKVSYREPNRVEEGREALEAQDWVIIMDCTPVLQPKETKDILIVLALPKDAVIEPRKWEFWISVIEQGQGMVQTEMCTRCLVDMR